MKTALISPYSKVMRNGEKNPKGYEHWERVIDLLHTEGWHVTQLVYGAEKKLSNVDITLKADSFKELESLVKLYTTWISVDNFFHHMAASVGKKGVVIFTRSDPEIYGHRENVNLLKDRKYLRYDQYHIWEQCVAVPEASIDPEEVVKAIKNLAE